MRKIGMILDKTFPPDPRVENEAISLVNNGFDVYLFCLTYKNQPLEENYKGINVVRYKSNKLNYKLSALVYSFPFYSFIMKRKIQHFLKNKHIEFIHIHDIQIAEAAIKANKFNLPMVLDLHDNMPEIIKYYPHLQKFPGKQLISPKKWKQKEEEFIKKVNKVITVSQEFVEEVIERTKIARDKIVLVPNTIHKSFYNEAKFESSIINKFENSFVILYVGDTGLRRGLLTVIRAIPYLKDEIENLKLVIVGKNSDDSILKNEVKKLNIEKYVDFEGWQNVSLFPSYIKASSICISPLNRNIQHDVAYANKLFQYMSLKKPLLVSNATAQKNLVKKIKAGLVHRAEDEKDFAVKIIEMYQNKQLCKQMGANGKRFVNEDFYWEKTSEKLIELYCNLAT
ncbi:glycosyltransferase family 4 protein [Lutibacter sp. TH_r2]|uniref:glycosyltransferase family 4 protein n=1 Tax=Lutibacter sp. TH_r2 TaxID=3082083 RepID=UPI002953EFDB|nr:glycosyltransferase family 4 protein [Lutibacter sp. TH_r2]MDV7185653.1 glycosyltransferase family 4 protein [Lutibacter sp. TH_r2]